MKNAADRGGCCRPRWITPSEICRILRIPRKPNSIIVLLFLQNNSKFKNKLKHANLGRCKFIPIGLQGLAVLAMFLDNISPWNEYNVPRQFRYFVLTTKTTQPRPLVFSVNGSITCNQAALLTSVHYDKILSKFGQQQLVMVNYACGFNQSETGKYFEWIKTKYNSYLGSNLRFHFVFLDDC